MSKSKCIIYIIILIIGFSACSTLNKARKPKRIRPPKKNDKATANGLSPKILERAENHFLKGKSSLLSGDSETAKYHFDRTLNILLDIEPALDNNQLSYIDQYLQRISEIELSYLKDQSLSSLTSEEQESILDEVISTPLFPPSQPEIDEVQKEMSLQKPKYSVPITINSNVVAFIKAFQNIRRKNIQNALNRSVEYIEEFKRIFREHEIPEDLAYLPLIESGYRVNAISRARARGMWQFMASTARMFGLRVDWIIDERRDPYKSAHAAAKLLKNLYQQYGNWYLALAGYNGGTRRINYAIKRLKTKDFFKIARYRYLRRETRNYVPAFLAGLIISKNPGTYGFQIEGKKENGIFANTKTVQIPSPVDMNQVAKLSGISSKKLRILNPELIREFTPFDKKHYALRVPTSYGGEDLSQLKRLPPAKKYFVGWYKVRRGDSLYSIARKFNTSVRKIKKANKLRSNLIHPGKRLLIPR